MSDIEELVDIDDLSRVVGEVEIVVVYAFASWVASCVAFRSGSLGKLSVELDNVKVVTFTISLLYAISFSIHRTPWFIRFFKGVYS
jgi:hypothetical protein